MDKKRNVFRFISKMAGTVLKSIAPDLYEEKEKALEHVDEVDKKSGDYPHPRTADLLNLLNKNMIKLNCSTSVYSRVPTILTFVIFILTLIMAFKQ